MAHGPDTDDLLPLYIQNNTLAIEWFDITSLPDLPNTIHRLICSYSTLMQLPSNLPIYLEELTCDHMSLHSLPKLPRTLKILNCYNTHITHLPKLPN